MSSPPPLEAKEQERTDQKKANCSSKPDANSNTKVRVAEHVALLLQTAQPWPHMPELLALPGLAPVRRLSHSDCKTKSVPVRLVLMPLCVQCVPPVSTAPLLHRNGA